MHLFVVKNDVIDVFLSFTPVHRTVVEACVWFWFWFFATELPRACPIPTAMAPMACAAPDAKTAPPAPAVRAGIAGNDPAVISIALMMLIALGCSLVRKSSAVHAFKSHTGALANTETVTQRCKPRSKNG